MAVVGKLLVAVSLTGTMAAGALAWNGGENLELIKSYAVSMKDKVSALSDDISFLNNSISGKNDKINGQKEKIAELEGIITQLTAERDALQAEVTRLTAENAQIPALGAQIEALNATIAELEGQVTDLQASLASLQADYDNTVAELETANSEITKANQESQELKDYAANLEAETTSTYNAAKVDRTNPMYEVGETIPTTPGEFPTLAGGWNSLIYALQDTEVGVVMNSIISTSIHQIGSYGNSPDLTVWLIDMPEYQDGDLDGLMGFLVQNSNIVDMPSSFNIIFKVLNSDTHIVTYKVYIDNATGEYVADRKVN
ncbi:hypothetical protein [Bacillus sp. 165]|uniref:hypothetical protein n=1 Tax=Bacillus sp. 165 TaxID=1529117 RepID=UPI001ADA44A0|nr:hypothetical protein [Bacillus sp. 165]MBO9130014.1 hypothetical protein [Bacillus sp. 165]